MNTESALPIHARQAIATRYVCPTNTRGARIRATCDRGSISIPYPDEASEGAQAHAVAVRALLSRFQKEDGADRSWPSFERWVCGGMPQASKDAYVWVQLPEPQTLDARTKALRDALAEILVEANKPRLAAERFESILKIAAAALIADNQGGAK